MLSFLSGDNEEMLIEVHPGSVWPLYMLLSSATQTLCSHPDVYKSVEVFKKLN